MSNPTPLYELDAALNFHAEVIRATRLLREMKEKARAKNAIVGTSAFIEKALDAMGVLRAITEKETVEKFRAALADCRMRGLVIKEGVW